MGNAHEISTLDASAFRPDLVKSEELLIAQAAVLHYAVDLSKREVAKKLGVPASKVTSLVKEAKRLGIVEYKFNMPNNYEVSGRLLTLFPTSVIRPHVRVVPNSGLSSGGDALSIIGLGTSQYLEEVVPVNSTIAFDGGATIAEVVEALAPGKFQGLKIYPVAGGLPHSPFTNPDAIVSRIAGKYGRRSGIEAHFFPPFEGLRGRPSLRLQSEGEQLIREASRANIFVLGVGVPHQRSTLWEILEHTDDDPESLMEQGIIGVFGYNAIDAEGSSVGWPLGDKLFRVHQKELKIAASSKDRRVILVASGDAKVKAIRALLKAGWINSLITDVETGEAILAE